MFGFSLSRLVLKLRGMTWKLSELGHKAVVESTCCDCDACHLVGEIFRFHVTDLALHKCAYSKVQCVCHVVLSHSYKINGVCETADLDHLLLLWSQTERISTGGFNKPLKMHLQRLLLQSTTEV